MVSYSDHPFKRNHRSRQRHSPPKRVLWVICASSLALFPKSLTLFLPHTTKMIIYLLLLPSIVNPQLKVYSGAHNFMSCSVGVKSEEMVIKYTWHDCAEPSFIKKRLLSFHELAQIWLNLTFSHLDHCIRELHMRTHPGGQWYSANVKGDPRLDTKWHHLKFQTLELCLV